MRTSLIIGWAMSVGLMWVLLVSQQQLQAQTKPKRVDLGHTPEISSNDDTNAVA